MEKGRVFFKKNKTAEDLVKEHLCLNAPVIVGLKPAAIFTVTKEEKKLLERVLLQRRNAGAEKGTESELSILTLYSAEKESILLYRKETLLRHLADKRVQRFLYSLHLGYEEGEDWILRFKERFQNYKGAGDVFPHEVGIFLGYPLWDIRAFIENPRQKAKLTGYWKVYFDVEGALRRFQLFDECIARFTALAERCENWAVMAEYCCEKAMAA